MKFTAELKTNGTAEAEIVFNGKIDTGWHVYSTNLGGGGPIEATFNVNSKDGVELIGKLTPRGKELSKFDKLFNMNVRYFEGSVQFVQKIKFTKAGYAIDAYLEYGACNDETCLPPTSVDFKQNGKSPASAAETNTAEKQQKAESPKPETHSRPTRPQRRQWQTPRRRPPRHPRNYPPQRYKSCGNQ